MNDFEDLDAYLQNRTKEEKEKRKSEYEKAIEPYPEDIEKFRHLFKEYQHSKKYLLILNNNKLELENGMDGFESFLNAKSEYEQMTKEEKERKFKELGYLDTAEVDAYKEKEIYDEFTKTHFSDENMSQRVEIIPED